MLTATDIHYVVGLLLRISEGADVDIELGSMVFDIAAEKERDVDITIQQKSGNMSQFKGLEVKRHSRPLDVGHVEQLCMKFQDMPLVSSRGIISASGFTKDAIKKARFYKVELFELKDWKGYKQEFTNLIFARENFRVLEHAYEWLQLDHHLLVMSDEDQMKTKEAKTRDELILCDKRGKIPKSHPSTTELCISVADDAMHEYAQRLFGDLSAKPGVYLQNIDTVVQLTSPQYFKFNKHVVAVTHHRIKGKVKFTVTVQKPTFKVLCKTGEDIPYVGCAIAEMQNKTLMGITTTKENPLQIIQIPLSDRLRNKIFQQKI